MSLKKVYFWLKILSIFSQSISKIFHRIFNIFLRDWLNSFSWRFCIIFGFARGHQIFYALAFFSYFCIFFFAGLIILAPRVLSQHSEMIQSKIREDPGLETEIFFTFIFFIRELLFIWYNWHQRENQLWMLLGVINYN